MKRTIAALVLLTSLAFGGCATLVGGGSNQPVTIQATPTDARYSITSSSGVEMGSGAVPNTVTLPRKNEYQINIMLDGYETRTLALTKGLNGWVWGNLVIGWIIGFAIDFITGSAYKLEPALVNVTLDRGDGVVAVVHLLNRDNELLREVRLPMVPVR